MLNNFFIIKKWKINSVMSPDQHPPTEPAFSPSPFPENPGPLSFTGGKYSFQGVIYVIDLL